MLPAVQVTPQSLTIEVCWAGHSSQAAVGCMQHPHASTNDCGQAARRDQRTARVALRGMSRQYTESGMIYNCTLSAACSQVSAATGLAGILNNPNTRTGMQCQLPHSCKQTSEHSQQALALPRTASHRIGRSLLGSLTGSRTIPSECHPIASSLWAGFKPQGMQDSDLSQLLL
jgi:hypothetical protein